ncbi:MAG TPA: cytochrome P450 [Ilumatobacteraceae bacterium]
MDIDLLDRDLYAGDPHPVFTWLRANEPVYRDPAGTWALTRHADVVWAERQPSLFSNAAGSRPNSDPQPSMIDSDDPSHGLQRRLVAKGFTPKQMAAYETHVRDVARRLVDAIAPLGRADIVTEIAKPLPMTLIGEMLGAPEDDYETLQRWSDQMITGADGAANVTDEVVNAAFEYYEYAARVIGDRTARPRDDLVSVLVHGEVDGERLDHERVIANALLLLVGGNETTRNVIAGGVEALLRNPAQLAALRAEPGPSTIGAVEECLRWVTPIVNMNRTTTADVDVDGKTIPAGSQVLMCYISANRDETVFDDPFRFDIARHPNPHIAFGFGPHFCLGSSLARLEIKVMLTELLTRLPDLHLVDPAATPVYSHSSFVRGIQSLPVEFTPVPVA